MTETERHHASQSALRRLDAGEAPRFSGLFRDERGMVVGTHCLVVLQSVRHRAAFLAALSHVADLAAGVTLETCPIEQSPDTPLLLVSLQPPDAHDPPSLFYETVQGALAAAHLSPARARLFIGDGQLFVPYASAEAPDGYDVPEPPPTAGAERLLLLPHATQRLGAAQPQPLVPALLEVVLQEGHQRQPPTTLTVLTVRHLAALIAGYVQRHGLAYAVRFLVWQHGNHTAQVALFDIVHAGAVRPLPMFVCDFLQNLPRTTLLGDALEQADLEREPLRRVLVAWGKRPPLYLPHIEHLLPPRSLLILSDHTWRSALVDRLPPRQAMPALTSVALAQPEQPAVQMSSAEPGSLHLHLKLEHDPRTHAPVHGLLLDSKALQRLQRIIYHLPAPLFAHLRIALGEEVALVVTDDPAGTIERLPIGQPLVRTEPDTLLLPYGMRLRPTLPPDLLIPTLKLQADVLTLLTPRCRYDVPLEVLQPLAHLLTLQANTTHATITMQAVALPPLDLQDLEDREEREERQERPAPPPATSATHTPPPAAGHPAAARAASSATTPAPERGGGLRTIIHSLGLGQKPAEPSGSATAAPFEEQLRQRARTLEQAGEYEIAAAFYAYLKDDRRAAHCYRQLVRQGRA